MALLVLGGFALAQPAPQWQSQAVPGLDPLLNEALAARAQGRPLGPGLSWRLVAGQPYVDVIVQTPQPAALAALGGRVRSLLPGFVTAQVPLSRLVALSRAPGVRCVWASQQTWPSLDVSVPEINADDAHLGSPPNTARGVIVGVVDTGLDWSHADFVDEAHNRSRVIALWDHTLSPLAGETSPTGFGYGVEYSQDQITDEVDGSPVGFVREKDTNGHGTHVAGIAAGDGSATGNGYPAGRYVGVAPEADLIIVKSTFSTTSVVDGVNYIFQKAQALGRPAVVNLSLGTDLGPHDGTDPFELALSSLVGAGRALVVAAGNSADDQNHATNVVPLGGSASVGFTVASGASKVYFDIWYDGSDSTDVLVHRPLDGDTNWVKPGQVKTYTGADGTVYIEGETTSPNNGDHEVYFTVTGPSASSAWSFDLRRDAASTGTGSFDAWTLRSEGSWFTSSLSTAVTITTPGTASALVTVGAYVTKTQWTDVTGAPEHYGSAPPVGQICVFSGLGPTRDGRIKPDLAAPGQGIASSLASGVNPGWPIIVEDGVHWVTQGASQASPHVAGTVALMLYKNRSLTPAQALSLLTSSARTDSYTGSVPNNTWGAGKVDALGATGSTPTAIWARFLGLDRLSAGRAQLRWQVPAFAGLAGCNLYALRCDGTQQKLNHSPLAPQHLAGLSASFAARAPLPADWFLVELIGLDGAIVARERLDQHVPTQ